MADARATTATLLESGMVPSGFKKHQVEQFVKRCNGDPDRALQEMEREAANAGANEDWSQVKSKKDKKAEEAKKAIGGGRGAPAQRGGGGGPGSNRLPRPDRQNNNGPSTNVRSKPRGSRGGGNGAPAPAKQAPVPVKVPLKQVAAAPIRPTAVSSGGNAWGQGPPISAKLLDQQKKAEEDAFKQNAVQKATTPKPSESVQENRSDGANNIGQQKQQQNKQAPMQAPKPASAPAPTASKPTIPAANSWAAKLVAGPPKPAAPVPTTEVQADAKPEAAKPAADAAKPAVDAAKTTAPATAKPAAKPAAPAKQQQPKKSAISKPQQQKNKPQQEQKNKAPTHEPAQKVKMPDEFKASEETFAFGNFSGDDAASAATVAAPRANAWGKKDKPVNPKVEIALDSTQGGFISGLMKSGSTGIAEAAPPVVAANNEPKLSPKSQLSQSLNQGKVVNASDYESQALAQANATVATETPKANPFANQQAAPPAAVAPQPAAGAPQQQFQQPSQANQQQRMPPAGVQQAAAPAPNNLSTPGGFPTNIHGVNNNAQFEQNYQQPDPYVQQPPPMYGDQMQYGNYADPYAVYNQGATGGAPQGVTGNQPGFNQSYSAQGAPPGLSGASSMSGATGMSGPPGMNKPGQGAPAGFAQQSGGIQGSMPGQQKNGMPSGQDQQQPPPQMPYYHTYGFQHPGYAPPYGHPGYAPPYGNYGQARPQFPSYQGSFDQQQGGYNPSQHRGQQGGQGQGGAPRAPSNNQGKQQGGQQGGYNYNQYPQQQQMYGGYPNTGYQPQQWTPH